MVVIESTTILSVTNLSGPPLMEVNEMVIVSVLQYYSIGTVYTLNNFYPVGS